MLPPVDAHFLRLVDGGDQETQLDGQQLDVEKVDLYVACDDDALVEYPFKDVGEIRGGSLRVGGADRDG